MTLEEMRAQRGGLVTQLRALHEGAEGRDLTPEENEQWDGLTERIASLKGQIQRAEQVEAEEAAVLRSTGLIAGRPDVTGRAAAEADERPVGMNELIRRAAGMQAEEE